MAAVSLWTLAVLLFLFSLVADSGLLTGLFFGTGALLAAKQVDQARSLLKTMGMDDRQIATDWTGERVQDLEKRRFRTIQVIKGQTSGGGR